MSDHVDVLLLRLAGQLFAIPLKNTKHICSLPANYANTNDSGGTNFVFQGETLAYISLWHLFQLNSEYTELFELQELLPKRKQDHVDWMNALEASIYNKTEFTKARDPHSCAFGKWYYNYKTNDVRLDWLISQFEKPHAHIHSLADTLLGLVENGQQQEALQLFNDAKDTVLSRLLELFDAAEDLTAEKQRPVAVIMADGDFRCALGCDAIHDIATVSTDQIKYTACKSSEAVSGFILVNDETIAPLIMKDTILMHLESRKLNYLS